MVLTQCYLTCSLIVQIFLSMKNDTQIKFSSDKQNECVNGTESESRWL